MEELLEGLVFGTIEDLGTQVFVYKPDDNQLSELTDDPGFGSSWNKYTWSSELFDGNQDGYAEYYAGTFNVQQDIVGIFAGAVRLGALLETGAFGDASAIFSLLGADFPKTLQSEGGEIHRYDFTTETWTQVLGPGSLSLDDGDTGFREMTAFDGQLFAATSRGLIYNILNGSDNPAKILVSDDGEAWSELSGGPLDPLRGNSSIRSMVEVEGPAGPVLLVGTENLSGAETWTYDQAGNWQLVAKFPGFPLTHAETLEFDGKIYLGTWAPYGLVQLDLTKPFPVNLTPLTPQNVAIDDDGVMQMVAFQDHFYMGSVNYTGGTSLFRTMTPDDPNSWEVITSDGFQTKGNGDELLDSELEALGIGQITYTWQTAVVDGVLYIGDFNNNRGLLLKSEDGVNFEIVKDDNGDPLQFGSAAYGIRQMLDVALDEQGLPDADAPSNALLIGSADPFNEMVPLIERFPPSGEIILGKMLQPDELVGTDQEDIILGGLESDKIFGEGEDDILIGGLWQVAPAAPLAADLLEPPVRETIKGGEGDDWSFGLLGDDLIRGENGEDLLVGGLGNDEVRGGANIDLIFGDALELGEETTQLLGPLLQLTGLGGLGGLLGDTPTFDLSSEEGGAAIEALLAVSPPLEDLVAGIGPALAAGLVEAFGPEQTLSIAGETSLLTLQLAQGDVEGFASGLQVLAADVMGEAIAPFETYDDWIGAGQGNDIVFAGLGEDIVKGHAGNDIELGEAGDDDLSGQAGDDILLGGDGDDLLRGGDGADFINGGLGDDTAIGGRDEDVFAFDQVAGSDEIWDFKNGEDAIDLRDFQIDPADFATLLLPAVTSVSESSVHIDLDQLGGSGEVTVKGLSLNDVDETDFWL